MRRVRSSPCPPRPQAWDDGSGNSSLAIEAWARSLGRVVCGPSQRPPVRALPSPSAAPITAQHKAARLRRASIASDARPRIRKQEGETHDRHRRSATAVVSRPQPSPVEHPARRQSRLAVRRVRTVCADLDGRSGHALLARAVAYPQIPAYIGTVVAITLLGWGIGGIVGGVLADYIGRKRTMILAILAYSIT